MNDTLQYIAVKYGLKINYRIQSVEIPNTNRETFATLLKELGMNRGAEIGVEAGIYSEILCKANPRLKLYSVDAWTAYGEYRDHVTQSKLDGIMAIAAKRLAPYNAELIKGFSMDVVKQFQDNSLDFVYIDGNHEYKHVVQDLVEWHKKVRVGGIVAGHDYIRRKVTHKKQEYLMHVIPAVHGFMDAYNIKPLLILGTKEVKPGELRDTPRSWFYVKPEPRPIAPGSGDKALT